MGRTVRGRTHRWEQWGRGGGAAANTTLRAHRPSAEAACLAMAMGTGPPTALPTGLAPHRQRKLRPPPPPGRYPPRRAGVEKPCFQRSRPWHLPSTCWRWSWRATAPPTRPTSAPSVGHPASPLLPAGCAGATRAVAAAANAAAAPADACQALSLPADAADTPGGARAGRRRGGTAAQPCHVARLLLGGLRCVYAPKRAANGGAGRRRRRRRWAPPPAAAAAPFGRRQRRRSAHGHDAHPRVGYVQPRPRPRHHRLRAAAAVRRGGRVQRHDHLCRGRRGDHLLRPPPRGGLFPPLGLCRVGAPAARISSAP
ncbi:hypothetical protein I4F81_003215 [Pyropia yezoensis]|uniref:Uncharacterized protein n=1 Tax=Pyropia yezoensis TaxID=2788 RepID=A0ACC3BRV1_PYRYE|nr:hypothetical protein I4F81_003215 [Neopyropia yezoensis]